MSYLFDTIAKEQLEACLHSAAQCCFNCSKVAILEYTERGGLTYVRDVDSDMSPYLKAVKPVSQDDTDPEHSDQGPTINGGRVSSVKPTDPCLRLCFISGTPTTDVNYKPHVHIDPALLKIFHEKERLSAKFIVELYDVEDWTVFPTSFSANGFGINLQYGFWCWASDSTHSFVQLTTDSTSHTYYCINFPDGLREYLEERLKTCRPPPAFSFFVDILIVRYILKGYRQGLVVQREKLQAIETRQDRSSIKGQVVTLHELSRQWHAMLKDFADIKEHISQLRASQNTSSINLHEQDDALRQLEVSFEFWARWVRTYLERTNICINLVHHLQNQDIAIQAHRESVSVFTLSIVTALFLPGTFVASILSTTFFSYDGSALVVSHLWWTLPVITIPMTAVVLYMWYRWSRTRLKKKETELERPGEHAKTH